MDNYKVERILTSRTKEWCLKKHYAKRMPSISYAYGLLERLVLVGICTFGKPASPFLCNGVCGERESKNVFELNRLVIDDNCPTNTASFFVSKALKLLPPGLVIVSYADTGMGHIGKVYQATNWLYTGITKERTDIGHEDGTHARHYSKELDYSQNRKVRTSKHRYITFTGTKRDKKRLKKLLNYSIQEYPKGQSVRYDASYSPKVQLQLF